MKPHKFKKLGRQNLLIIFQSMNAHLYKEENANKFELEGTFSKPENDVSSCDYLFIKDEIRPALGGGWYLNPSESVYELIDFLSKQKKDYNKICATGISAGGFASILFGSLCMFDLVLAVDPQTILYDFETNKPLHNADDTYLDLKPHINNTTKYYMYNNGKEKYKECDFDGKLHHKINSYRLRKFDNVFVERFGNVASGNWKSILKNNGF
jgi:hypothetical protein